MLEPTLKDRNGAIMVESSTKLTWLGHNCFQFERDGLRFIVDPFLVDGVAPRRAEEIDVDYILVSHGHADHCQHAVAIAKRCGATIVAVAEMASYFSQQGLKTEPMNIGGAIYLPSQSSRSPKVQVLAVQAPHSSTTPSGTPGGNSMGFVLSFAQNGVDLSPSEGEIKPMKDALADANAFNAYFACDAGFFSELSWIGALGIDLAVLPIGDRYTMGPRVSLDAIAALSPKHVVPSHYNTWPPISQNADAWSAAVRKYTQATPLVPKPGQTLQQDDSQTWR